MIVWTFFRLVSVELLYLQTNGVWDKELEQNLVFLMDGFEF